MSRFDLYASADGKTFILDLQSDFLESYSTRVVAPVVSILDFHTPAKGLNPVVEIDGDNYVVLMHFLSAVPASRLIKPVRNLSAQADELTRALDMLFQGY